MSHSVKNAILIHCQFVNLVGSIDIKCISLINYHTKFIVLFYGAFSRDSILV